MERIVIRVKRLREIDMPAYGSPGASGLDIRAAVDRDVILAPGQIQRIPTGLALSMPSGYEAQIRPRSGLALNHGIGMVNAPGTVDSDYRGEIGVILVNWGAEPFTVSRGDRIAQLVFCRVSRARLEEVADLDETDRGEGGFGHTGTR